MAEGADAYATAKGGENTAAEPRLIYPSAEPPVEVDAAETRVVAVPPLSLAVLSWSQP